MQQVSIAGNYALRGGTAIIGSENGSYVGALLKQSGNPLQRSRREYYIRVYEEEYVAARCLRAPVARMSWAQRSLTNTYHPRAGASGDRCRIIVRPVIDNDTLIGPVCSKDRLQAARQISRGIEGRDDHGNWQLDFFSRN